MMTIKAYLRESAVFSAYLVAGTVALVGANHCLGDTDPQVRSALQEVGNVRNTASDLDHELSRVQTDVGLIWEDTAAWRERLERADSIYDALGEQLGGLR